MKQKIPIRCSEDLAEVIGIMMGDGCLHARIRKGRKTITFYTMIAFHKKEYQYLKYVRELLGNVFDYTFRIQEIESEFFLVNISVFVGEQLIKFGLRSGNKVKNKLKIPLWIKSNKKYLLRFIRGFFDTDGCVYRKYDNYAQIQIKTACEETTGSVRSALLALSFNPTKTIKDTSKKPYMGWKIYLSRQKEIDNFFETIQPANIKHVKRYKEIKNNGDAAI